MLMLENVSVYKRLMQTCPLCVGNTVNETRARKITYKEHSIIITQPTVYCDECGEAFLTPNDSRLTEKAIADFIAMINFEKIYHCNCIYISRSFWCHSINKANIYSY